MADKHKLILGETIAIQKPSLNLLLSNLEEAGFRPIGPQVHEDSIILADLRSIEQLPQGYVSRQAPGQFRLVRSGTARYFDFIPAAQSWKQFLFPPRIDLLHLHRGDDGWTIDEGAPDTASLAFIGVRACELAAILMQDKAFLRDDYIDEVYHARRARSFILAVNCLHPAGTCFCATMSCGPEAKSGYDLCLTELDDAFLLAIGSELGRTMAESLPSEIPGAFLLGAAERGLEIAAQTARCAIDADECGEAFLQNLDHPHWDEVAARCLSCGSCTLVCPTCFCWDVTDATALNGTATRRERLWDSCFNPGYSYQAGGNTRPTIRSRYRQWLSHKFGSWKQQFGTLGCVGCGRCITWCPAGIDTREEVPLLQKEAAR